MVIPQVTRLLITTHAAPWVIVIVTCVLLPVLAISLLYMIIYEIQHHYMSLDLSDKEVEESQLVKKVLTEDDEKFIEEKMREQLDKFQFEDEDLYEVHVDLILTYVKNRVKIDKSIPLRNISKMVEIPEEVVKDILLVLIADGLVDGMIEKNVLVGSD